MPKSFKPVHTLAVLLVGGGLIGFLASFELTLDKIRILQNPGYVPGCNINPIISCGSVMKTHQASIFGFANSIIGIAAFTVLITIGIGLLAGAEFKRWFWRALQACVTLGLLFAVWLIIQSLYVLGTLCPYCVGVWIVMIPIFWYTTLYNIQHDNLPWDRTRLVRWLYRHHGDVLISVYLLIGTLILIRWWYYWKTLF